LSDYKPESVEFYFFHNIKKKAPASAEAHHLLSFMFRSYKQQASRIATHHHGLHIVTNLIHLFLFRPAKMRNIFSYSGNFFQYFLFSYMYM